VVPFGRRVWRAYFFSKNLAPASRPTGAVLNKKPAELCRTDLKNKTKKQPNHEQTEKQGTTKTRDLQPQDYHKSN